MAGWVKRAMPSVVAVLVFATLTVIAGSRVYAKLNPDDTSPSLVEVRPSAAASKPPAPTASPTPDVEPVETDSPPPDVEPVETDLPPQFDTAAIEDLLAQVEILPTRPQLPGYERDCGPGEGCVFGTSWTDDTDAPDGHNGCDTRNDVLAKALRDVVFKPGSNDCDVVAGHFIDPYTGREMFYENEGSQIHIDHLVPLAAAWDLGAADWTQDERERFANDTELELVAAEGGANMSKGDSTPASWLPPNKPYRCEYVTRYLQVSIAYDLPITRADAEVIGFAAQKC